MRPYLANDKMTSHIHKHIITYHLLDAEPSVFGFSTTRHGGCSTGTYKSFNCTVHGGDFADNVIRNRKVLSTLFPTQPLEFVIPHQVHLDQICVIDENYIKEVGRRDILSTDTPPQLEGIDAVITNIPRYCICVSTADCVPILLYDKVKKVIAAVHAGWRGTRIRIVETVITRMKDLYGCSPTDMLACIGPSISLESFEVGDEVYDAFLEAGFDINRIARRYEKWHIDLWEANKLMMEHKGIPAEQIEIAGICTYKEMNDFFSARRLGKRSGRILNGIMLL